MIKSTQKIPIGVSPAIHVSSLWPVRLPITPAIGLLISPRSPGSPFSERVFIEKENSDIKSCYTPRPSQWSSAAFSPPAPPDAGSGRIFPHWLLCPSPLSFLIPFLNPKMSMLLSASLVPITIVTEDFDKAVILTEALKGQAQSCALQLQSSMRLSRILSISDLNPLPGDQALSW